MKSKRITRPPADRWDRETLLVAQFAGCISVLAFLYYLHQGSILLYGDAGSHIGIARKVFDSRTPGLLQLGTVWLPLPHLVMIPFIVSDRMWQTGIGGSIPSLAAFVLSVVGIYRLVSKSLESSGDHVARATAWGAAAIFALNPNLIYLQSTAMTEPIYLALFIWSVVYFSEFAQQVPGRVSFSLLKCALCLAGACLTRYDGWFLTFAIFMCALIVVVKNKNVPGLRAGFVKFALVAAAAPILWLAYNAVVYRNPFEFANGPYSAKAIEQRTSPPGSAPHPGTNNLPVAFSFFLKAGELMLVESNWHRLWLALALAGTAFLIFRVCHFNEVPGSRLHKSWPLLLLWIPIPFYMLSIAYSGVPIFIPPWWPYSIYNARYGVQLLPAFAVFAALAGYFASRYITDLRLKRAPAAVLSVLVMTSYLSIWYRQPLAFREAWINSRSRTAIQKEMIALMQRFPPNSTILMYTGYHIAALQEADIPLRRLIYEGNHRTWKQPSDPEGLWERALADPAKYADYVIAADGDPVGQAMQGQKLQPMEVIHVTGQPAVTIYRARPRER